MSNRDRHSRHRGPSSRNRSDSRNGHHGNSWKNSARSAREELLAPIRRPLFRPTQSVTAEQIRADEDAIREFKSNNQPVCPRCGKPVADLAYALPDRSSGEPVHFDCAVEFLTGSEPLGEGERIAYIGQGRFGVLNFPNIHDARHFTIRKIIDWEEKDNKPEWRGVMADLYSKVK